MYYNIKIITKDSEFALESYDRAIIEREMDIYFARIFGASEEFASKIRPIKINNPDLKSINEIDNFKSSRNKEESQPLETVAAKVEKIERNEQKNIDLNLDKIINSVEEDINIYKEPFNPVLSKSDVPSAENYNMVQNFHDEKEDNRNNVYNQLNDIFSQPSKSEDTVDNSPFDKDNQDTVAEFNINKEDAKEFEDEAEALFKELQAQVELQKKQDNVLNLRNEGLENPVNINKQAEQISLQDPGVDITVKEDDLTINNEVDKESLEYNNNKINNTENIITLEDEAEVNQEQQEPIKVENILFKDDSSDNAYQDIIDAYQEQDDGLPKAVLQNDTDTESDEYNAVSLTEEVTGQMFQPPQDIQDNKAEESAKQNQDAQDERPLLSFNKFLSGFMTDEIHDEFLVCCAYIKNVLNQGTFTIKYINSKLFQATGKIADTTIVDDLIKKEYIKVVSTNEFTLYAIAQKGEEYLASKLPD